LLNGLHGHVRPVGGNGVDRELSFGYGRNGILIHASTGFLLSLFSLFLDAGSGLLFGVLALFVEIRLGLSLGRWFR
jgi:hypothetical protein